MRGGSAKKRTKRQVARLTLAAGDVPHLLALLEDQHAHLRERVVADIKAALQADLNVPRASDDAICVAALEADKLAPVDRARVLALRSALAVQESGFDPHEQRRFARVLGILEDALVQKGSRITSARKAGVASGRSRRKPRPRPPEKKVAKESNRPRVVAELLRLRETPRHEQPGIIARITGLSTRRIRQIRAEEEAGKKRK